MIWAGMSEKGVMKVAFLHGKQDAINQTTTLQDFIFPFTAENHQRSYIFQQDNASLHCANVTKQ